MSGLTKAPKDRTREDYYYFLTYRTRWSDNDQYSHVNNAIYYHLIDSIVNTYLAEQCGCKSSPPHPSSTTHTSEEVESAPIGLVVSSHCEFLAPISFPETITLGLRVVKLGRSSVSYEVGFFVESPSSKSRSEKEREEEGEGETAKAVGGYTHVFVDRLHRRPIKAMSTTLRNGLEAVSSEHVKEARPKL